jgi:hypothetical protein
MSSITSAHLTLAGFVLGLCGFVVLGLVFRTEGAGGAPFWLGFFAWAQGIAMVTAARSTAIARLATLVALTVAGMFGVTVLAFWGDFAVGRHGAMEGLSFSLFFVWPMVLFGLVALTVLTVMFWDFFRPRPSPSCLSR